MPTSGPFSLFYVFYYIDFRSFLHILEDLTTLKEIHTSSSHAIISSIEGLEELALRVPSLRVFQWEPSYNITLVGKVRSQAQF